VKRVNDLLGKAVASDELLLDERIADATWVLSLRVLEVLTDRYLFLNRRATNAQEIDAEKVFAKTMSNIDPEKTAITTLNEVVNNFFANLEKAGQEPVARDGSIENNNNAPKV